MAANISCAEMLKDENTSGRYGSQISANDAQRSAPLPERAGGWSLTARRSPLKHLSQTQEATFQTILVRVSRGQHTPALRGECVGSDPGASSARPDGGAGRDSERGQRARPHPDVTTARVH